MISIIIPTLEEEKAISSTLASLKSQLSLPHELIVSDGGSADRTAELARAWADKVVVHDLSARQTISQGRNRGAERAAGDLLVFLDADCTVPDPDRFFTRAIARFETDAQLLGLTCNLRFVAGTETLADKIVLGLENAIVRFNNNTLGRGDSAGGEFQMIRASAFRAVGGYREDLVTCEDREIFRRLARVGRTRFEPALTVFHSGRRVHTVGWPRLIVLFILNTLSLGFRGRVVSKEWEPVR
jgi:glycosyltransferase involved in cell wall biosynthesis